MRCPGQDLGRKKPEDIVSYQNCPNCDYEIEFFFDDTQRICHDCRLKVDKEEIRLLKDYGCAAWCDEAERCLSAEVYAKYQEAQRKLKEVQGGLEKTIDG